MQNSRYPFYVLALLWAAALLRFVDLQIVAVLLESIKAEFRLDDTRLALLGGAAFALFYGVLGLPVAWLAERYCRRTLIAAAVTLWSLMTMLCGQASSFGNLLLARIGVGIGEAGGYPPTTSLLADYFPPAKRGRACAIIASAIPIGVLVGFAAGGLINAHYGWRATLQVVGLPGVLLGLLILLTLREPRRLQAGDATFTGMSFLASSRQLWRSAGYPTLVAAACLFTLGATGSGLWIPSYFIRHHGLSGTETGIWMALLYGGGGLAGSLLGGWLAQRADRDGSGAAYATVCRWSLAATLPLLPFVLLLPYPRIALCCHAGVTLLMHMNVGPVLTLIQKLAGERQRALAHAWSLLVSNVVALPLGPLAVGWFSDRLTPVLGSAALGYGILAVMTISWAAAAWLFNHTAQQLKVWRKAERGEDSLLLGLPGAG
ncbi:MAG TPA: MFS transporter [Candidatus Acidoferrum sp.]|nr:MFS transporter [Candidatus Acidoferrum sp.]